ncbi:DUF4397 domain-containing protein [Desulforamulus aeronauticus]|uniref:DUF4397 domain-containing protein n=1 Tax=Desulforamulus aeronauticus DSM 10349 TaxID=1121421 RepID=A0A1M6RJR6_9FIRM|nr:DUF4397 domain-containing protein [Desulforamulus aeronauticus]SHK32656.1 protein of unknown function [Desulforamulus aeronauticus DSM 10349]
MPSYIRVLHASPDAPPVDLYADNTIIAKGLSYRNFTEYLPVSSGTHNIKVVHSESPGEQILESSQNIPPNSIQTIALVDNLANIRLLPISDQPASLDVNKVNLKFVHLAPDLSNVDLTLPDGTVLFSNVSFKEATDYLTLNPNNHTLQVRVEGEVILTVPNQKLSAGKVYSAYLIGRNNGNPPLQLLTPLDGSSYLQVANSESGQIILDSAEADVNGDGIIDKVYLIGNKPDPESPFTQDIRVCVEDGKTNNTICATPASNEGYNANVLLGDFTGDKISDILVRIESGGSGGYLFAYVYSVADDRLVKRFDYEEFNKKSQFNVVFKDNYKVEVTPVNKDKPFIIDVSNRKEEFSDLYNSSGKLIMPVQGSVLALGNIEPVVDNDSNHNLLAIQRIIGRFNAETLGYVKTTLQWDGVTFSPVKIEVVQNLN